MNGNIFFKNDTVNFSMSVPKLRKNLNFTKELFFAREGVQKFELFTKGKSKNLMTNLLVYLKD